jgi:hypothetical protein
MLSVARLYSLHAVTGTSTGLCLTDDGRRARRGVARPRAPNDSPSAEVDARQCCCTRPHGVRGTASGRINLPDCRSADQPAEAPCSKNRPWSMLERVWAPWPETEVNTKGLMMLALLLRW